MIMRDIGTAPLYSTLAADPDLGELVDLFVSEIPERVATLQAAMDHRDMETLARCAYQLKGAAGSYGFRQLTPSLRHLELLARQAADDDAILAAMTEIKDMCARVRSGVPE